MDPFSFSRQTGAFVAVIAVMAAAVFLVFPLASAFFGAIAALLLAVVWVKRGARTGHWLRNRAGVAPLTQAEGAFALSAAVLLLPGVLVVAQAAVSFASGERTFMTGLVWQAWVDKEGKPRLLPANTRAVHYSDADKLKRLKEALTNAGVPYTVETKDGKEYVGWTSDHAAAADEIERKVREGPFPGGGNAAMPAELQQEFRDWLAKKGVANEVVKSDGREFVVWEQASGDLVREFMEQRPTAPCVGQSAAVKSRAC